MNKNFSKKYPKKKFKSDPISELVKLLKRDMGYRIAWKANIAMAFKDRWRQYKKENKKKAIYYKDIHVIANESAEYFLKLLCDQLKYPKGR